MTAVGHVLATDLPALKAAVESAPRCESESAYPGVECCAPAEFAVRLAHAGDLTESCDTRLYLLCAQHLGRIEVEVKRAARDRMRCVGCRSKIRRRVDIIRSRVEL